GTPTMGGLLILLSLAASALLWMRPDVRFTWVLILVVASLGGIGFWDDYSKLVLKNPAGISSRAKFTVQIAVGLALALYLAVDPPNGQYATRLGVPYTKELFVELGPLYFVLAVLMVVGSSNAVNLTDGLDGLATGSVIFCAIGYGVFAYAAGNA